MHCSTPGFPVHHHLPELAQTHFHSVSDAIQLSLLDYPLSSCLQSFPESGSFPVSQLFTSGGQRIAASASASVFLMNIQGSFASGVTGLISLKSKGLSRVFSGTIWKHQFFCTQPSLWSSSHIWSSTWLLEKPMAQEVKNQPAMQEMQKTQVWSLGQEDSLEKKMATQSSILAWETPWTEEPGGLQDRKSVV